MWELVAEWIKTWTFGQVKIAGLSKSMSSKRGVPFISQRILLTRNLGCELGVVIHHSITVTLDKMESLVQLLKKKRNGLLILSLRSFVSRVQ